MGVLHLPMISLMILILSYNLSFHALSIEVGNIITPNQSLADGQVLVSPNRIFALGFFTPTNSTHRYLGVWYNNISIQTVVWVANRQTPIVSGSGVVLNLSPEGNLALRSRTGSVPWSTNTSNMSNPFVKLLDSGNLVLTEGIYDQLNSSNKMWQSFDYPSDTLLPGMKLGWELRTNREMRLTSWQSTSDPSLGPYTYGIDLRGVPELYIWNRSVPESRSEYANGQPWNAIDSAGGSFFSMQFMTTNDELSYTFEIYIAFVTSRLVLNQFGTGNILVWESQKWELYTHSPADQCDVYGKCGAFGLCSIEPQVTICSCLMGFEPRSPENWMLLDASDGCVRRTSLGCPDDGDGFLMVSGVKLPATNEAGVRSDLSINQCTNWCLMNCSCTAYAFLIKTSECISWHGDLVDTRDSDGGDDLYVRLAAKDLEIRKRRREPIVVIAAVSLAVFILCSLMLLTWIKCKYKWTKASTEKTNLPFGNGKEINFRENERDLVSPIYSLSSIIQATDNFSYVNKLGEGGFGPVYKGQLTEGQEIAVKRLAARSGQGLKEFENEIILIAKLQHRNLVRLMGYCIHGEEKILIYEYMPNKSLDYFLFDTNRRAQLDWGRRLHIIEGISQGLLYLHKHSRLRIIHRDLKASNILLDADMNPKISDFGMAKIFGSNETEANTNRIVGTYGYMSPEYAAGGLFSVKSDVFSFGVLLLEIVSGSKNTIYYQQDNTLNLLGYAWELWKEAKWLELVDPSFDENCPKHEISRCIHVALMCVQENAIDRPNMSDVIAMLSSDSAILDPKQPAFFNVRNPAEEARSVNEVTVTDINGR